MEIYLQILKLYFKKQLAYFFWTQGTFESFFMLISLFTCHVHWPRRPSKSIL